MSIRFTCTACRTVMKIDEMITEERKVRCTGCRIVILLKPDPGAANGIAVSFPKKSDKPKGMSDAKKRNIMLVVLGVMAVIVGVGLFLTFRSPPDRGPVEGFVTIDGGPMLHGTIKFISEDPKKAIEASAPIVQGRFELRTSHGPALGMNKIEVRGDDLVKVVNPNPPQVDIGKGPNKLDVDTRSK